MEYYLLESTSIYNTDSLIGKVSTIINIGQNNQKYQTVEITEEESENSKDKPQQPICVLSTS